MIIIDYIWKLHGQRIANFLPLENSWMKKHEIFPKPTHIENLKVTGGYFDRDVLGYDSKCDITWEKLWILWVICG